MSITLTALFLVVAAIMAFMTYMAGDDTETCEENSNYEEN